MREVALAEKGLAFFVLIFLVLVLEYAKDFGMYIAILPRCD